MSQYCVLPLFQSVSLFQINVCSAQDDSPSENSNESFSVGKNGRPVVLPVVLDGRTLQFLLDTGAARTCFDTSLKSNLGSPADSQTLRTPTGLQVTEFFECPRATIGRFPLHTVKTVGCVDLAPMRYATGLEVYGILGCDFCIGKVFELDFDQGNALIWSIRDENG